ncbi:DUF3466 family protein [Kangiella koreensis]|uniref:DUF3466 family protein n=1 Tax=Kangiella koreensis (strain DSM 16069 / JCM 12317 / KCTC 12182 / SW-125) TaxID=523791 RepID=C7RCD5_KANKD|nr:DUF3466 family protein [Kangiella koreensis]ACV26927.1 hypothetical protein Kkor_1515 [Kangiella koreensis DSM 16069]
MKQKRFKKTLLASLLTLSTGLALSAPYEIVDLGGLDGNYSVAYKLNEQGIAVGVANGPETDDGGREFFGHAVKFQQGGNEDLGVLTDGTFSEAVGINSSGIAVGYANQLSEVEQENGNTVIQEKLFAIIFDGGIEKLIEKDNLSQTRVSDINDSNLIVGYGMFDVDTEDDNEAVDRGFVYNNNDQTYFMVPSLADDVSRKSYMTAINNSGKAIGFADAIVPNSGQFTIQSFIVDANNNFSISEIPTVDNRATFAHGINIHDEVVGSVYISGTRDNQEAFYYDAQSGSEELTFLGFLRSDFTDSRARAINDNRQIVGRALVSAPTLNEFAAFIYEDEEMKNLNELIPCNSGWKLTEATDINNAGQIIGFGAKDGEIRAFRLDPTGGAVESCDIEEDNNSGGGSVPFMMLVLLSLFGLRRKKS